MESNRVRLKGATQTKYQNMIDTHIIPSLGGLKISQINSMYINTFLDEKINSGGIKSNDGLSASYVKTMAIIIEATIKFAVAEGWCAPLKTPIHKPTICKSEPTVLSKDTEKRLLRILLCEQSGVSIGTLMALNTGMRIGEVCALKWDDVDFQKGTVSVSKTLKRVRRDVVDVLNGKDILYQFSAVFDEGRTVTVLKRPKTKSSIRTVYLPGYVLDALQEWKETLKPVKRNHPDLVLRYSNGRPLSEETLPRLLEKQLLQLRLPIVSFHSLRHSSISYKLVLTGGNIKAVQGDSGHAQAEMITERYGHIIDTCRKQCAQDFEEEFYKCL